MLRTQRYPLDNGFMHASELNFTFFFVNMYSQQLDHSVLAV